MGYKWSKRRWLSSYVAENKQRCSQFFFVSALKGVVILEQIKQDVARRNGNHRRCCGGSGCMSGSSSSTRKAADESQQQQPTRE
jgi:hypothetical protein